MRESTVGDPSLRPVAHSDDTIAFAACGAFLTSPQNTGEVCSLVLGGLSPCAQRVAGRFVPLHGKLLSLGSDEGTD